MILYISKSIQRTKLIPTCVFQVANVHNGTKNMICKSIKLLVVDDNVEIRNLIRLIFKHQPKVEVFEAINAADGFEKFESLHPDIVFSDIMMPGDIDGIGLCKQIKASNHICPVVLISGKYQQKDIELGMQAGADLNTDYGIAWK